MCNTKTFCKKVAQLYGGDARCGKRGAGRDEPLPLQEGASRAAGRASLRGG
jgi:hypothetical protein